MVYLVGTGPGDPGLMTCRGMELLRRAEVVLYDRLIDSALLCETQPGCILVDVGKSAGRHTKPQDEISSLLVLYGRDHDTVVRLKGGDPFLFGRGGEEALELREAGIPFCIVPGVSALSAVPAYAGIPVTHRDHASSLGVATGHGAGEKDHDPVRWRELARAVDTIVVFMGVQNLAAIAGDIIAGGRTPETPAALIRQGTTPRQSTVTATLGTIAAAAGSAGISPPALLVVGEVAGLAGQLSWYDPGPLGGLRIGITRPLGQSASFAGRLRSLGAHPVVMPTIAAVDTIDTTQVRAVIDGLPIFDCVVFSSANGVESFFRALQKHGGDARRLAGLDTACIGPATAQALAAHGIGCDILAETYVAEGLCAALTLHAPTEGRRFLLVRSDKGRTLLRDELLTRGALVEEASFYATVPADLPPYAQDMVRRGDIDIVTFTSSSTVESFFAQVPPEDVDTRIGFASIGPQTTAALERAGVSATVEAAEYTTAGLADAILRRYGRPAAGTE